jgi:hypothetical protein
MRNGIAFPRVASSERLPRLDFSERLFLWGFRAMAEHHRCGRPIIAAMRQVYAQFHVEDAVSSLDGLIEAFARTARTPIEIHSPCCPCVSESEALLLRAIAGAQAGSLEVARRIFERWLPELAADWVLSPACGLGRIFQTAGMTLPLRGPRTMGLRETATIQSWSGGPQVLH